jgi:hypothetical protein
MQRVPISNPTVASVTQNEEIMDKYISLKTQSSEYGNRNN